MRRILEATRSSETGENGHGSFETLPRRGLNGCG